jgi:hypothetical protein
MMTIQLLFKGRSETFTGTLWEVLAELAVAKASRDYLSNKILPPRELCPR